MDFFQNILEMTGFSNLFANPGYIIMLAIGCLLLYLGISKKYEPLLLVPIGFGVIIANIPNSNLGVVQVDQSYSLIQIANEYGIKWFTKNVSPYIEYKTFIIGSGFENLKSELEQSKNVSVIGRVDSLSEWYINAEYVIAPIFEGSGMKTKVAEAMMYGKKILATSQALIGYEDAHIEAYYVCNTKTDYVELLSKLYSKIPKKFNENLRQLYLKEYSLEASKTRLERFL